MRRVAILFTVLSLANLVSADGALAFGWRGQWRGSRYQNCHCRSAAAATHHKQVPAQKMTPVTTATLKGTVQSAAAVKMDESAALTRLLDVMKEIIELQNDRLDRELEHYEWIEEHDHE